MTVAPLVALLGERLHRHVDYRVKDQIQKYERVHIGKGQLPPVIPKDVFQPNRRPIEDTGQPLRAVMDGARLRPPSTRPLRPPLRCEIGPMRVVHLE